MTHLDIHVCNPGLGETTHTSCPSYFLPRHLFSWYLFMEDCSCFSGSYWGKYQGGYASSILWWKMQNICRHECAWWQKPAVQSAFLGSIRQALHGKLLKALLWIIRSVTIGIFPKLGTLLRVKSDWLCHQQAWFKRKTQGPLFKNHQGFQDVDTRTSEQAWVCVTAQLYAFEAALDQELCLISDVSRA